MLSFSCTKCGEIHEGLPDLGFDVPDYHAAIPDVQRSECIWATSDLCRIEDDYFIRGSLEIPIIGREDFFSYGLWMSVSEKNFARYSEIFDLDDPPSQRYVGYISNRIAGFPDTLNLVAAATPRSHGLRPLIELQPVDRPLSRAQLDGWALDEVIAIVSEALHP